MKISYKILWIDDELGSIKDDRRNVEDFLEEFGIHADISIITNSVDQSILKDFLEEFGIHADISIITDSMDQSILDLVRKHIDNPELDILLVDYHMKGMDGDKLVSQIRNTDHVYLPVIFYSSSSIEVILKAAYDAQLDGVYITHRDHLTQKFENVARSLLNKEHTTKRTRGLLMEEVSEIDAKFKDVYEQAWGKLTEGNRDKLTNYLKEIVEKQAQYANNKSKEFPNDTTAFSSHMDKEFLSKSYDTYTRWRVVRKMLNYLEYDDLSSRNILKRFGPQEEDSLLNLRNIYAHNTRLKLEESHSDEKCVEIRRELRHQQSNIDRIVKSIKNLPKI